MKETYSNEQRSETWITLLPCSPLILRLPCSSSKSLFSRDWYFPFPWPSSPITLKPTNPLLSLCQCHLVPDSHLTGSAPPFKFPAGEQEVEAIYGPWKTCWKGDWNVPHYNELLTTLESFPTLTRIYSVLLSKGILPFQGEKKTNYKVLTLNQWSFVKQLTRKYAG